MGIWCWFLDSYWQLTSPLDSIRVAVMAALFLFSSTIFRGGLDICFGIWYNNLEYNTYGVENDLKDAILEFSI